MLAENVAPLAGWYWFWEYRCDMWGKVAFRDGAWVSWSLRKAGVFCSPPPQACDRGVPRCLRWNTAWVVRGWTVKAKQHFFKGNGLCTAIPKENPVAWAGSPGWLEQETRILMTGDVGAQSKYGIDLFCRDSRNGNSGLVCLFSNEVTLVGHWEEALSLRFTDPYSLKLAFNTFFRNSNLVV